MPSSARQSQAFSVVAGQIVARLADVMPAYLEAAPNPKDAVYKAEAGLHIRFGPPQPFPNGGGQGRYGLRVVRPFQVWVVVENLSDPAGRDESALAQLWAAEEAVVNALVTGKADAEKIGVGSSVQWSEGGDEARRAVKTDVGIILSVLAFTVEYMAPVTF